MGIVEIKNIYQGQCMQKRFNKSIISFIVFLCVSSLSSYIIAMQNDDVNQQEPQRSLAIIQRYYGRHLTETDLFNKFCSSTRRGDGCFILSYYICYLVPPFAEGRFFDWQDSFKDADDELRLRYTGIFASIDKKKSKPIAPNKERFMALLASIGDYECIQKFLEIVEVLWGKEEAAQYVIKALDQGLTALEIVAEHAPLALSEEAQHKYTEIVDLLVSYGADINYATFEGTPPLYRSAFNGNEGMVNILNKYEPKPIEPPQELGQPTLSQLLDLIKNPCTLCFEPRHFHQMTWVTCNKDINGNPIKNPICWNCLVNHIKTQRRNIEERQRKHAKCSWCKDNKVDCQEHVNVRCPACDGEGHIEHVKCSKCQSTLYTGIDTIISKNAKVKLCARCGDSCIII